MMDLEGIMLSEISQTEKVKYCTIFYVESEKKKKGKNLHSERDQTCGSQRRRSGSGVVEGGQRYTLQLDDKKVVGM